MNKKYNFRLHLTLMINLVVFLNGCVKNNDDNPSLKLPKMGILPMWVITDTSVVTAGYVINDEGSLIMAKGFCWSAKENPTISDKIYIDSSGRENFYGEINGLIPNTTYFIRSYATNGYGTGYSESNSFSTLKGPILFNPNLTYGTVSDVEGNVYKTITIGTQTWMAENLNTKKYNDGTAIACVSDSSEWGPLYACSCCDKGAYCNYKNDEIKSITNGKLYNWYAVNTGKLAPKGWHIPSDNDWKILDNYLFSNGYNYDGKMDYSKTAKSLASSAGWKLSDGAGAIGNIQTRNNSSGFTALPSGERGWNGSFYQFGESCSWWTSTDYCGLYAYSVYLCYFSNNSWINGSAKGSGLSIRCVKDDDPTTVRDIDGNVYKTVIIGTQTWMAENLKTTRYNDGTIIPSYTVDSLWRELSTGGCCYYDNDLTYLKNIDKFGLLYNWFAVNTGKLAPQGWHVPTDTEWTTMENYLIANGYNYDGTTTGNKIAKSLASKTGWGISDKEGAIGNIPETNNRSGFNALPGGECWDGVFSFGGDYGYWWSSSENETIDIVPRALYPGANFFDHLLYDSKSDGFSVRCLKD
jgi:uncharacterized protein (TIGR02145 family)